MTALASRDGNVGSSERSLGAADVLAPTASEEELLDVLYEVLAQGVPPRSSLTREEVERFLHEHAREPKPLGEMVRFFERHALPTQASAYGADQALGELADGLQKERASFAPGFLPAVEVAPPPAVPSATETGALRALAPAPEERTGKHAAQRVDRRGQWLGYGMSVLVGLVLLAGFVFSYERSSSLEQRLEHARMQQRSTDAALTKLEQRAASLSGALARSEAERTAVQARLEATLSEQAKKRAAEEQTLERLFGPRYRSVREKVAREVASTTP